MSRGGRLLCPSYVVSASLKQPVSMRDMHVCSQSSFVPEYYWQVNCKKGCQNLMSDACRAVYHYRALFHLYNRYLIVMDISRFDADGPEY